MFWILTHSRWTGGAFPRGFAPLRLPLASKGSCTKRPPQRSEGGLQGGWTIPKTSTIGDHQLESQAAIESCWCDRQGMRNGMTQINHPLWCPFRESPGSFPHSRLSTSKLLLGRVLAVNRPTRKRTARLQRGSPLRCRFPDPSERCGEALRSAQEEVAVRNTKGTPMPQMPVNSAGQSYW